GEEGAKGLHPRRRLRHLRRRPALPGAADPGPGAAPLRPRRPAALRPREAGTGATETAALPAFIGRVPDPAGLRGYTRPAAPGHGARIPPGPHSSKRAGSRIDAARAWLDAGPRLRGA